MVWSPWAVSVGVPVSAGTHGRNISPGTSGVRVVVSGGLPPLTLGSSSNPIDTPTV